MVKRSPHITSSNLPKQKFGKAKRDRVSKQRSWVHSFVALIFLASGAGLASSLLWLSLQLFINPNAATWVTRFLPKQAKILQVNQAHFQTLAEIKASITQLGKIPGEPLTLETNADMQPKSILLPVLHRRLNCQIDCEQIVELQVYQLALAEDYSQINQQETFDQVASIAVEGPEEWLAIAPFVNGIAYSGSNRPLPLTQLHRFEGNTPTTGVWLYLLGRRMQGASAIAYGQVVHYNPKRSYLSLMLPWTSPTGQIPQWQQITGGGFPELVVDETVDLEPKLHVYQVKPAPFYFNPIQLERISLLEPALKIPAYQDALFLARNGLWSPAWKWLQFIRQRQESKAHWSAQAQAQMDLIELYAQRTQEQAEKTWISPSQEVLVNLIDGRWSEALQVFQASPANTQEITPLLEADSGRLWHRVEAALRINPKRLEVQAWGALIRAAQKGRASGMTWLKQQPKTTPATLGYVKTLLNRLEGNFYPATISSNHPSRIVGSVELLTNVDLTQWLQPEQTPTLKPDQQWYQVQVAAYHDGESWQRTPFSNLQLSQTTLAKAWHQLGFDSDSQIQIIVWLPDGQQETKIATVKAVQLHDGILRLLATSPEMVVD